MVGNQSIFGKPTIPLQFYSYTLLCYHIHIQWKQIRLLGHKLHLVKMSYNHKQWGIFLKFWPPPLDAIITKSDSPSFFFLPFPILSTIIHIDIPFNASSYELRATWFQLWNGVGRGILWLATGWQLFWRETSGHMIKKILTWTAGVSVS